MRRTGAIVVLTWYSAALLSLSLPSCEAAAPYHVTYYGNLAIAMRDNITLYANAFVPVAQFPNETFPLLLFPTSWATPDFEYIFRTLNFAERGYVAVEYEVRGWYRSGGHIDTIGPKDVDDASDMVSWALSMGGQWGTTLGEVAFVGISQGAGIALMAAARDTRVTTSVSLSGWNNLTQMAYDHETPNMVWGAVLELMAQLVGRPGPDETLLWNDLLKHQNMTFVKSFLEWRSPQRFVESQYNPRKVPLFLSNNFLDRLFKPQHMLSFFESLTEGPKMLLLNQGIHAEAEVAGLIPDGNYIWKRVRRWLDYFLKGAQNGILQEPKVQLQVQGDNYQTFPTWPVSDPSLLLSQRYFLGPRGSNNFGTLTRSGPFFSHHHRRRENKQHRNGNANEHKVNGEIPDVISFSTNAGLSDGIPLIGDLVQPVLTDFSTVSPNHAIVYTSGEPFNATTRVCGTPRASLSFRPAAPSAGGSAPSEANRWQLYFFFYAVDTLGIGTLLSDGPFTHYDDREARPDEFGIVTLQNVSLHTICDDVAAGQYVGFGITLYNALYAPANASSALSVELLYGENTYVEFDVVPAA